MSNAVSALKGASFDGLVTVSDAGPMGMITLRGDLASIPFATAIADATGCGVPQTRQMTTSGDVSVLWMSPDELLVLCSYDGAADLTAKLAQGLSGSHALAVNVSDARACFDLKGAGLRDVFAKLTPANLGADALPVGEVRRTKIAQIAAGFWLTSDDTAQLICFRSFAPYMYDLLCTAADPDAAVGFYSA